MRVPFTDTLPHQWLLWLPVLTSELALPEWASAEGRSRRRWTSSFGASYLARVSWVFITLSSPTRFRYAPAWTMKTFNVLTRIAKSTTNEQVSLYCISSWTRSSLGDVLTSADLPQTSDARFHRETFWSVLIIQLLITNIVYQMTWRLSVEKELRSYCDYENQVKVPLISHSKSTETEFS